MRLIEKKSGLHVDTGDSLGGDVFGYFLLFFPFLWKQFKRAMLFLCSARMYRRWRVIIPILLVLELIAIVAGVARLADIAYFSYALFFYWRSARKIPREQRKPLLPFLRVKAG